MRDAARTLVRPATEVTERSIPAMTRTKVCPTARTSRGSMAIVTSRAVTIDTISGVMGQKQTTYATVKRTTTYSDANAARNAARSLGSKIIIRATATKIASARMWGHAG